MKRLLLAITGYALCTASAAAQDAAYDWSGVYLGGQIGYGWSDAQVDYLIPSVFGSSHDPDGFLGGAYAGYNYHLPNRLVLGLETDIAWTSAGSGFKALLPDLNSFGAVDIDYSFALRARLGLGVDRFLPYIAGGFAASRARIAYDMRVNDADISTTLAGWTLGAGLEYAASDNLILRAEYRYSDFGDGSKNAFPTFPNDQAQYDLQTRDLRIGIAYKF